MPGGTLLPLASAMPSTLLLLLLLPLPLSPAAPSSLAAADAPRPPLLLLVVLPRPTRPLPPVLLALPWRARLLGWKGALLLLLLLLLLAPAASSSSGSAGSSSLSLRHGERSGGLLGMIFSTCMGSMRACTSVGQEHQNLQCHAPQFVAENPTPPPPPPPPRGPPAVHLEAAPVQVPAVDAVRSQQQVHQHALVRGRRQLTAVQELDELVSLICVARAGCAAACVWVPGGAAGHCVGERCVLHTAAAAQRRRALPVHACRAARPALLPPQHPQLQHTHLLTAPEPPALGRSRRAAAAAGAPPKATCSSRARHQRSTRPSQARTGQA
jgi:hypothetical protein